MRVVHIDATSVVYDLERCAPRSHIWLYRRIRVEPA
jgi:hypothetical protein